MRSSLSSKRGEFFIVTVVGSVVLFFAMSRVLSPYSITDVSRSVIRDEIYFFNDVKENLARTIQMSECEELVYNIETFKNFTMDVAAEKGYKLRINYEIVGCSVNCTVELSSEKVKLKSSFSVD